MTRARRLAFLVAVAAQAVVPLALIGWNEVALARGSDVRLRTVPVDPLDLFRGRYVTLRYEISRLRVFGRASVGDTVYVELRQRGDRWTGYHASPDRPPDGSTFIRGRVRDSFGDEAAIEYGIETYYADEDEARQLERRANGALYVDVVLDADGRARIDDVVLREG